MKRDITLIPAAPNMASKLKLSSSTFIMVRDCKAIEEKGTPAYLEHLRILTCVQFKHYLVTYTTTQ
jgi:hypothetical protein